MFKKIKNILSLCLILFLTIGFIGFISQKLRQRNRTIAITINNWYASSKTDKRLTGSHERQNQKEEVVVNIQKGGYVTKKNEAYYYYEGNIPENSLISNQLCLPSTYHFKKSDIKKEYEEYFVVKVEGKLYIVLKNPHNKNNIREIE